MKQRRNDPWLFAMQIILPLLVLMALNPLPQTQIISPAGENDPARERAFLEPWHPTDWETLLQADARQGNWQQLITDAGAAGTRGMLSDEGRMLLGDAYNQAGQKNLALGVWKTVGPAGGTARFEKMLQVQRETNDLKGALDTLNLWLQVDPQNGKIIYQKALLQAVLSPREASDTLDKALLLDAGYKNQAQTLKQALAVDPSQPEAYRLVVVGRALASLGEWQLAHVVFQQATGIKTDYAEAWAFLGESEYHLGMDDYPSLKKALALDAHSTAAQSLMGLYWIRQGQPDKALAVFQQLVKQEPQQPVWEIESGDALGRMGQAAFAMVHYQNAVRLDPGNPQNWVQLIQFCLQYNLEVRRIGLPAARRLVIISPQDPLSYDWHGRVLLALGDSDNAEQAFYRGLKIEPGSAQLLLDLGIMEMGRQQNAESFYYLSQAVRMGQQQNDDEVVKKAQALINQH